jgi:hypothetical protein
MEKLNAYKLDRYKAAFSDYEVAARIFHEGVLGLSMEERADGLSLKALTYELDVKHRYFIECARRLSSSI